VSNGGSYLQRHSLVLFGRPHMIAVVTVACVIPFSSYYCLFIKKVVMWPWPRRFRG